MSKMLPSRLMVVVGIAVVALVVAACGSSSSGSSSSNSSSSTAAKPASASTNAAGAAIGLRKTDLGKVLVDGKGQTLYLFEADKGMTSNCDGACATSWPPLTTSGKPTAMSGALSAKLGTTKRSDGSTEVTYNGHPLYTYAGDQAPGQTSGQGIDDFGAEWYVLSRAGQKIEHGS
jgi:predicted lipoprotein with Yx(FWY)xxD motif